jgi:hypothetical protein
VIAVAILFERGRNVDTRGGGFNRPSAVHAQSFCSAQFLTAACFLGAMKIRILGSPSLPPRLHGDFKPDFNGLCNLFSFGMTLE